MLTANKLRSTLKRSKNVIKEEGIGAVYQYFLALYRVYMMAGKVSFLIRDSIKIQIIYRLGASNPSCMDNGECSHCGCEMPDLLFANKQCKGKEYPKIMNLSKFFTYIDKTEGVDRTTELEEFYQKSLKRNAPQRVIFYGLLIEAAVIIFAYLYL